MDMNFQLVTIGLLLEKHLEMLFEKLVTLLFSLFFTVYADNTVLVFVQPEQIHLALGGKLF